MRESQIKIKGVQIEKPKKGRNSGTADDGSAIECNQSTLVHPEM